MQVLITGGSGAIGSAIKASLLKIGHSVISPNSKELDLSDPQSVSNWLSANANYEFDGIVLCAGVNIPRNLIEDKGDEYQRVLQVNTHSGREILRSYLPGMKERRFGRIVAISSSYALIARDGRSTYSISKAALEALVRSVAIENASFNILANSIIPGFIETPLTLKNNNEGQIQKILERIPVGRLGTPNEIATLVNHLISESNSYITGQSIQIDGGFSIN